jgi:hypothetical protein
MTCIDSTHGGDSNGGKLKSFGYISFDKPDHQGSKYRHTYIPLVFSKVKEENKELTLLMFSSTLGFAVSELFGLTLDVKGGRISDHAPLSMHTRPSFRIIPMSVFSACLDEVQNQCQEEGENMVTLVTCNILKRQKILQGCLQGCEENAQI